MASTSSAKPLVHSYSSLNCYDDVCPHQYWHRYILKDVKFVESDVIRKGNEIHTAFEQRLQGKRPFPPHLQHCEPFAAPLDPYPAKQVEQWYGVDRTGQACDSRSALVFLRGKIDCAVAKDSAALLFDWKSSKNDRYEKPFELEIGALFLKAKNPYLMQITGRYAYTELGKLSEPYDLSDTDRTWRSVKTIVGAIEHDLARSEFEMKPGPLCSYCDVRTCKHNRKPPKASEPA